VKRNKKFHPAFLQWRLALEFPLVPSGLFLAAIEAVNRDNL